MGNGLSYMNLLTLYGQWAAVHDALTIWAMSRATYIFTMYGQWPAIHKCTNQVWAMGSHT